ncbi:hypothetical protein DL769_008291 [Monosporascus sp. CRB-8-3]|nr:hypothetical protein DL769_008291 [Monosporascus sp. CRB-8-3]
MPPALRPRGAPPVYGQHVLWALLDVGIDVLGDESESESHKEHLDIAATTGAQEDRAEGVHGEEVESLNQTCADLFKHSVGPSQQLEAQETKARAAKAKQWEAVETMEPSSGKEGFWKLG